MREILLLGGTNSQTNKEVVIELGDIIKTLKENSYEYTWGTVTVRLAEAYGFCWGVERAVQINIWLNNEIIHNPTVNQRLQEMKVQDIPVVEGEKQFEVVNKGDVVILPAFGAAVDEMLTLIEKNVQIIDTTCPWTPYVKLDYNAQGRDRRNRKLVERTMMQKFGVENINEHFMSFNTICDATQERQDAMYKLVEQDMDLMLVFGGWNSSKTSHLQEIAEECEIPSYWIDREQRIGLGNKIAHKLMHGELVVTG
ncbi:4-hydroxy-3-methylbut-2-enyl diphosphate reductase [Arachis hypogaea]|nr:4-hydroxy-3-methylbut-2-enyl diphosphate reductase [Arachis hypogaea]